MRRLRSGAVARAAGISLHTMRYYERRGLLPEPERSNGGHRSYPPETVGYLVAIKKAQRLGFTLDEAHAMLVPTGGRDVRSAAQVKLAEVERRIAGLQAVAAELREMIDLGCVDMRACAVDPRCPAGADR